MWLLGKLILIDAIDTFFALNIGTLKSGIHDIKTPVTFTLMVS